MTINSNNYEEFFLLYVDNELDAAQRAAVEAFAAAHPDLQEELNVLLQAKLPSAEEVSFKNKSLLYKEEIPGLVTPDNYETFFLLYTDNELPEAQRAAVEKFVDEHPEKKQEWLLLQHTKLQADDLITCPDKESLYRIGKKPSRIIPFAWMRVAAAAAVIIAGGWIWMNAGNKQGLTGNAPQQVAAAQPDSKTVQNTSPAVPAKSGENLAPSEKAIALIDKQETTHKSEVDKRVVAKATEKRSLPAQQIAPATDTRTVPEESPVAIAPQQQVKTPPVPEPARALQAAAEKTPDRSPVKPVILDAAAFSGDRDIRVGEQKQAEDIQYLSTNNDDKRSKGKLRGLFRKASRLIDRVTNAEAEDERSIVRVASFEIAKK